MRRVADDLKLYTIPYRYRRVNVPYTLLRHLPRNQAVMNEMNAVEESVAAAQLDMVHKGPAEHGGLSALLQQRIPNSGINRATGLPFTKPEIIKALRDLHMVDYPEFNQLWPALRDYLRNLQNIGELDPLLVIPN